LTKLLLCDFPSTLTSFNPLSPCDSDDDLFVSIYKNNLEKAQCSEISLIHTSFQKWILRPFPTLFLIVSLNQSNWSSSPLPTLQISLHDIDFFIWEFLTLFCTGCNPTPSPYLATNTYFHNKILIKLKFFIPNLLLK